MGTHKHSVGATTTIDLVIADTNTKTTVRAYDVTSTNYKAISVNTNIFWKPCQDRALRYDKANWNAITTGIMLLNENNYDPKHVQSELTRIVLEHTPRARMGAKAFWNKNLQKMRQELLTLKKTGNATNIAMAKKSLRKAIGEAKKEARVRALQEETDPECFRAVKLNNTQHPIPALIRKDGTMAGEHPAMGKELHHTLYSDNPMRPMTEIQEALEALGLGILDTALKASPNGAATGPDSIPTRAIRILRKTRESLFLNMMN